MDSAQAILITGSATRVGKAIALHLAAKGYDIAVHCNRSEEAAHETAEAIRKAGRRAAVIKADLTDPAQVASVFLAAGKVLGKIHGLINNASVFTKDALGNFTSENLAAHFGVHVEAPLLLIRDFAAQLPQGEKGNIINLTDGMYGWSISDKFLTYSLSKMALGNIAPLLARSLAPRIRINTIAPGPTIPGAQDLPDTFSKLEKILPLQHVSKPKEVCDAIDYLLQAQSVTGQTIQLGGGIHTLASLYE